MANTLDLNKFGCISTLKNNCVNCDLWICGHINRANRWSQTIQLFKFGRACCDLSRWHLPVQVFHSQLSIVIAVYSVTYFGIITNLNSAKPQVESTMFPKLDSTPVIASSLLHTTNPSASIISTSDSFVYILRHVISHKTSNFLGVETTIPSKPVLTIPSV